MFGMAAGVADAAFALSMLAVMTSPQNAVDLRLHDWLVVHRTPALTGFALVVTSTGASTVLVHVVFVVALAAARGGWSRLLRTALLSTAVLSVGVGIRLLVSDLVARSRPPQRD